MRDTMLGVKPSGLRLVTASASSSIAWDRLTGPLRPRPSSGLYVLLCVCVRWCSSSNVDDGADRWGYAGVERRRGWAEPYAWGVGAPGKEQPSPGKRFRTRRGKRQTRDRCHQPCRYVVLRVIDLLCGRNAVGRWRAQAERLDGTIVAHTQCGWALHCAPGEQRAQHGSVDSKQHHLTATMQKSVNRWVGVATDRQMRWGMSSG